MKCKICGCIMKQDHDGKICECCRDEYENNPGYDTRR